MYKNILNGTGNKKMKKYRSKIKKASMVNKNTNDIQKKLLFCNIV